MAVEVQMPNLGLSIPEGTIDRWAKKEGDRVERGDILVVIITEKVTVDLPAEASGILLKIIQSTGAKVKVGEPIAIIGQPGENVEAIPQPSTSSAPPAPSGPPSALGRKEKEGLMISPLATRIAAEHGVDIREVATRFPGQKIGKKEVFEFIEERKKKGVEKEAKAAPPLPSPAQPEEIRPLSGPLRAMAEHMAMSARTAARVTTTAEVDMTELVHLRSSLKEKFQKDYGVNLTFVPFVMRAMCEGVKEFPILNASLQGENIISHRAVNIGVAVDAGESLLVPVVKNVHQKGVVEISRDVSDLSAKARDGKLTLPDIQGGTITLTNAGVYGALLSTPIIHQPQSAILWMGKAMETPVVRNGQIVIRSMMYLCLSYDHRIIMGAQAVQFLQVVKKNLENPYPLLLG